MAPGQIHYTEGGPETIQPRMPLSFTRRGWGLSGPPARDLHKVGPMWGEAGRPGPSTAPGRGASRAEEAEGARWVHPKKGRMPALSAAMSVSHSFGHIVPQARK